MIDKVKGRWFNVSLKEEPMLINGLYTKGHSSLPGLVKGRKKDKKSVRIKTMKLAKSADFNQIFCLSLVT